MVAALQDPSDAGLEALSKAVDLDRFLSFWATEVLVGHWDGYAGDRNNYQFYREPDGPSTEYDIPTGYIYPILSSFRAMLVEENGKWTWGKGVDPIQLIKDGIAANIFISSVRESINNHHNPNRTGKDGQAWTSAYQAARIHYLELPTG